MTPVPIDPGRRRWVAAASVTGGAGVVAASVPLVGSLASSERARALGAAVEADTRPIRPGELVTVEWRGRPVWVFRRTPQMLSALRTHDELLADARSARNQQPAYARNEFRSIEPEVGVLVAICPHLGCIPSYRPEPGSLEADWPGGFFCPCHGSKFDLAGRVYKNVPAPANLDVPPHRYVDASVLLIGEGQEL